MLRPSKPSRMLLLRSSECNPLAQGNKGLTCPSARPMQARARSMARVEQLVLNRRSPVRHTSLQLYLQGHYL